MLYSLLDTLNTALLEGDIQTVLDTLQAVADIIKEAVVNFTSEKSRELLDNAIEKIEKLIKKLSARKSNRDRNLRDVRRFANELRAKLKQRLIEKIKEKSY